MLKFLRHLLGGSSKPSDAPVAASRNASSNLEDFRRLNDQVPLQDADDKHQAFVRREAILDRSEKIAGYEFLLLTTLRSRLNRSGAMARRAYDAALLTRLTLHGVTSLLGHRLAFINLSVNSLADPLIDKLPSQNSVLMLDVSGKTADWKDISGRLAQLREKGFFTGLRIHDPADAACPLQGEVDFFQVDVTAFDGIDLKALAGELKKVRGAGMPPRLLARDVQSHDDFRFCEKCGFDYFQGPFISSRESFHVARGGINRMIVLPILRMVRSDQAFSAIADQLRNEPTLSYKLLRYLNSPAMGLGHPIDNLTQALVVIGRDKFYRWMSLLLFDIENPGYHERALAERALARGRTLELLAGSGNIPRAPDHLFLIGLFSLLDVALGQPLPELVEKAALPDAVRNALLGNPGPHADALALAVLGEADAAGPTDQMQQALDRCGISDADYAPVAAAALVWANLALSDPDQQTPPSNPAEPHPDGPSR